MHATDNDWREVTVNALVDWHEAMAEAELNIIRFEWNEVRDAPVQIAWRCGRCQQTHHAWWFLSMPARTGVTPFVPSVWEVHVNGAWAFRWQHVHRADVTNAVNTLRNNACGAR